MTGEPLAPKAAAVSPGATCAAHPIPATYPVGPAQTRLPASAGDPPRLLHATDTAAIAGLGRGGLHRLLPEWIAFGCLLLCSGMWRMRRRAAG